MNPYLSAMRCITHMHHVGGSFENCPPTPPKISVPYCNRITSDDIGGPRAHDPRAQARAGAFHPPAPAARSSRTVSSDPHGLRLENRATWPQTTPPRVAAGAATASAHGARGATGHEGPI